MCHNYFFEKRKQKRKKNEKKRTDNLFTFIVRLVSDLPNAINPSRQQRRMKNTTDRKKKQTKIENILNDNVNLTASNTSSLL